MYVGSEPSRLALRAAVADAASPFWDDPGTPAVETRDLPLAAALDDAGAELRGALGDPSRWAWARVHTTTFREQTLGKSGIGILEGLFNAGPYGVPGTSDAVNNGNTDLAAWYPDPDEPDAVPGTLFDAFTMTNHPSYRLTVEMAPERLDAARIVIQHRPGRQPGRAPLQRPGGRLDRGPHRSPPLHTGTRWKPGRPPASSWSRERGRGGAAGGWAARSALRGAGSGRPVDQDPAILDRHRVDGQRLVGGRVQRLAGDEVEAGQVERTCQAPRGDEAAVQLEVLVAADPLDRADSRRR